MQVVISELIVLPQSGQLTSAAIYGVRTPVAFDVFRMLAEKSRLGFSPCGSVVSQHRFVGHKPDFDVLVHRTGDAAQHCQ
jgi:hypothetical protein